MLTPRILKGLGVVLVLLAILVYVGYMAVYVVYTADLFRWPFDYDQGEGFELYDAILYSQGEWPYKDSAVYPFYSSNYPPLFHLLIVPLLPVFGPNVVAGRVVSFVATLIAGGTILIVVRRKVGGRFIPIVSGLAFFASNYVYQTGPLCRMHITMVMFETLAIALIAEFEHPRHGRRNLILGLLMLLCAGYTKQMAVFTVVAALSYVFLRDVKKAILSGVVLAAVAGAIFWLLNVATEGQWWINTIQANVNEFKYLQALDFSKRWFGSHTLFILLALAYLIYELFWDRLSAYSLWFLFALVTGALSGKVGAGPNYFTTAVAAACITSGLALGRLRRLLGRHGAAAEPLCDLTGVAAGAARFPPERAWHLLQDRLRRLRPWAAPLLAVLIPLLYLLQAPRMLHLPTSGPVFGPLARTFGVDGALIKTHCKDEVSGEDVFYQYHDSTGYTQQGHLLTADDYAASERIMHYVRTSDGPVFSEEAMFSLQDDRPVVTNPTQLLNLYDNDLLDTTEIIARIERREFGVIILRAQFYPPPVRDAIGQHYELAEDVCMNGFVYHILLPRPPAD